MKSILNRSACKELALDLSKTQRNGRFKQVSKDFLDRAEAQLRAWMAGEVHRHPSVGVTLK